MAEVVCATIWHTTPETGSRLRGRIESVWASAQVAGHIDPNRPNPARWKNWLSAMLPDPRKLGDRGHHAAMDWQDVPAFVGRLRATPGTAARALEFAIVTMTRTSETLNAPWREFDLDAKVWTIPKERMKTGEEFRVPLSDQALAILTDIARTAKRPPTPERYVFASPLPRQPLSAMAMLMLLRRLKVDVTTHGFRSSARSWMSDHAVEFEIAEASLSHRIGSAVSRAYNRSDVLARRRVVMEKWSRYVGGETAKVVKLPIKRRAR